MKEQESPGGEGTEQASRMKEQGGDMKQPEDLGQRNATALKSPVGSVIFGTALVVAGILLGLGRLGWLPINNLGDLWPLVLIGIGVSKLWQTWGTPAAGSGAWLVLAGVWFLLAHMRLFGVTLRNSWPLMLILAGIIMVWRSLVTDGPTPRGEEVPNGR